MKTIAIAAVVMMLSAPAWADEPAKNEANYPANTDEPIVLSEVEMDGVTAGYAIAGGDRIAKFADNNSPIPQDRTFDAEFGLQLIHRY